MRCSWSPEMSSDGNHAQVHMTLTACNICTCAIFFNCGLPTYFVSQYCWGRALYAVFYGRVLTRAEPLDCGVANIMLKVTHVVFAWFLLFSCAMCLVCFGQSKNLIFSGFARDWCRSPSRILYINLSQCCVS